MGSIISLSTIQTALELGVIYSLVALALFLSFSMLNVCDLSTDSCFTLGCAVGATVSIAGHPILAIFAAMLAGILSGYITGKLVPFHRGHRLCGHRGAAAGLLPAHPPRSVHSSHW